MAYEAYERFIEAAKKFPRWTNIRRRPNESAGGKILKSIIEEIAAVQDAIIEYKKDFFLKYYKDRTESIVDYIYAAHVGDIENLDEFALVDPVCDVTTDEGEFYNDRSLALYQDGYIVLFETNETNTLQYKYNGYTYSAAFTKEAVWNTFDEFAWWCGLERFPNERNKSLWLRSLNQLRYSPDDSEGSETSYRPNSTEQGLKNAITNAAIAKIDLLDSEDGEVDALEPEEIEFLEPNEETLALLNEAGDTLYEEISQFNRDIARTRKWDMDYWDNNFRQLRYLPHRWDADVAIYQNGVGYHDALKVTTADKIGAQNTTDITIYGYNYSAQHIDSYIQKQDIRQDISLELTRYKDTINPYKVQYRILGEDLIPVQHPEQISFTFFRQCREGWYDLDQFVKMTNGDVVEKQQGQLDANTAYTLTFTPADETGRAMEITRCNRITGNTAVSLLEENDEFRMNGSSIINRSYLFHGDKIADFTDPVNLKDRIDTGFVMDNPLIPATASINLKNWCVDSGQPLDIIVDPDSGWQDITSSEGYIRQTGFKYDRDRNVFVSSNLSIQDNESFVLEFLPNSCRQLQIQIEQDPYVQKHVFISAITYVDGVKQKNQKYAKHDIGQEPELKFQWKDINHQIKIEIKRIDPVKIKIGRIRRTSYSFEIKAGDKDIVFRDGSSMSIPKVSASTVLELTVQNGANPISPIIRYVHVGPVPREDNAYIVEIPASTQPSRLDIQTNCNIALYNHTTRETKEDYTTHTAYSGSGDIILDLSLFKTLLKTNPAVKRVNTYGEDAYYFHIDIDENKDPITKIWVQGMGYKENAHTTLAEIATTLLSPKLASGETLYFAKSFQRLMARSDVSEKKLGNITQDILPISDRVVIEDKNNPYMQACFETASSHITNTYTGSYNSVYLYDTSAKEYIAYNTEYRVKAETTDIEVIPSFSPKPKDMALLSYRIDGIAPKKGVSVVFNQPGNKKTSWSLQSTDTLTITVNALKTSADNTTIFGVESAPVHHEVRLSNVVNFRDIIDDAELYEELAEYNITPPDNMEVVYQTKSYPQTAYRDGAAMYIENDGFNKLKHANITKINKIRIDGIDYENEAIDSILTLLSEPGIICWKDTFTYGTGLIELVEYEYQYPDALRFKNIESLYTLSGYDVKTQNKVNVSDEDCIIRGLSAGESEKFEIGPFKTNGKLPDIFYGVCSNDCYQANVKKADNNYGVVTVSRIAEDRAPVIHNGYYYVDGREHYFYSDKYEVERNRLEGIEIVNGRIVGNVLYLYKEARNYIQNSRMECNKLSIHCIVDFNKPRAQTNIDPIGHIGACESFSAWEDYGVSRSLTSYKNGQATQFKIQQNGYALLDITPYLAKHKTISCLFNGDDITFELAQEIRILGEQALKSVYCESVDTFTIYQDIAYCIPDAIDTTKYRYYLVVKGTGILDEILIHDFTEPEAIAAHHIKAIDKLDLVIPEENNATQKTVSIEYSSDFMRYNQLETDTDTSLRTGTTVDWNITKLISFELNQCKQTGFLSRGNGLVAQADNANLQTPAFEIQYLRSIRSMALKVNQYIDGNKKDFKIRILSCASRTGTYKEIAAASSANCVEFEVGTNDKFIKAEITAKEDKIITDITLFAVYKEVGSENLNIYYHTNGSAVTKVFHIGAVGTYRFKRTICETGYDKYKDIHVRGAKQTESGEYVWTSWSNTATEDTVFEGYELFQFKIRLIDDNPDEYVKVRIKAFEFEVL